MNARDRALREVLLVWGLLTFGLSVGFQVGRFLPILGQNLGGLAAVAFVLLTFELVERRGRRIEDYGIHARPWPRTLLWGLLSSGLVLGGFTAIYLLYYDYVCGTGGLLGPLGRNCRLYQGLAAPLRLPGGFWIRAATELAVVAIPEEMFYRGYVLTTLDGALGKPRRLAGVEVGWGLVLQAALFGLGHFLIDFNPLRLAVALPALLFGYLRLATGNIGASVVLHAASNLVVSVLDATYFPTPGK